MSRPNDSALRGCFYGFLIIVVPAVMFVALVVATILWLKDVVAP